MARAIKPLIVVLMCGVLAGNVARAAGHPEVSSDQWSRQSYVFVSLIKSIAGVRPTDEFFDVRLKFTARRRMFLGASIDAALSANDSSAVNKQLSDASVSFNWGAVQDTSSSRAAFAGPVFRVFNGNPYFGTQVGGQELRASVFAPTQLAGALMWSLDRDHHFLPSLFVDFFIAAKGQGEAAKNEFFNKIHLRGGYLIPLQKGTDPQSRIIVEVPIGDLTHF